MIKLNSTQRQRTADNQSSRSNSTRRKRCVRLLIVLFIAAVLVFVLRTPLLTGMADLWVVNEPVQQADAVVVLGGGLQSRPQAAARVYKAGLASQVLIIHSQLMPTDAAGVTVPERQLVRQVLVSAGVPNTAIIEIGENVSSTMEEAVAVKEWMQTAGAARVIVPTDLFHTRRVRWVFRRTLEPVGATALIAAIPSQGYDVSNWWQNEEALSAFQNEIVKQMYYWVKY